MNWMLKIALFVGISPSVLLAQGKTEADQTAPHPMGLGILGAEGNYQVDHNDISVTAVQSGGLVAGIGLQVGDKIFGANGKDFEAATNNILDGGKGPQEGLGYAIQSSLKNRTPLELKVKRGSQTLTLKVPLPPLRPFAKSYPENCPRTDKILEEWCSYLRANAGPDVAWGNRYVTSSACGLCLLANGDKKDAKMLKDLAHRFCQEWETLKVQGGLHSWNVVYTGTYLCEYYLATGDTAVLPTIKLICEDLVKRLGANGRSGHGYEVGYDGAGLNIITTNKLLVWALAGKCGVKIDTEAFDRAYKHCLASQQGDGCVCYIINGGGADGLGRTGIFALAMAISGKDKEKGLFASTFIHTHMKQARECHANGVMGMLWAPAALSLYNQKGYREFMDYWAWYFELANRPEKDAMPVWYIGSKRNNGGDEYLNKELYFLGCAGSALAVGKHNLFIHGNTKRGWLLGKRSGGMIAAYRTSCKSSAELLDAVADKVEDLSAPEELKDALAFSRDAARISEKGKNFREELIGKVRTRAGKLAAFSALRPAYAQSRLKTLGDLCSADAELGPEMKLLYKRAGGDPSRSAPAAVLYDEAASLLGGGGDGKKISASTQAIRFKSFVTKIEALCKARDISADERLELEALAEWARNKAQSLSES
ncbi:MAG: hypothetical protein RL095_3543 [Verrucomicrobiota bacterium]|jgi:hypothetical protein